MTKKEKVSKMFEKGLFEKLGLTLNEFETGWTYAGGDNGRHLSYAGLLGIHKPDKVYECICYTPIKNNCYMMNKEDKGKVAILGICCIEKFAGEDNKGRTCEICEAPHRNRVINRCNVCKVKKCKKCKTPLSIQSITKYPNTKNCYDCFMEIQNSYRNECLTCSTPIQSKYTYCYKCFNN